MTFLQRVGDLGGFGRDDDPVLGLNSAVMGEIIELG
jgi:hypothetical protein